MGFIILSIRFMILFPGTWHTHV